MFDTKDLEAISQEYFNIICTSEYDVTVQSKNTGHFWYLHNVTQPNANACVIFHKHKYSHPYHLHGRAKTLRQAIRNIQSHDKWFEFPHFLNPHVPQSAILKYSNMVICCDRTFGARKPLIPERLMDRTRSMAYPMAYKINCGIS